jgi:hypothetical protein
MLILSDHALKAMLKASYQVHLSVKQIMKFDMFDKLYNMEIFGMGVGDLDVWMKSA